MMPQAQRHPDNPPGPFYVERDCCIACEAPYNEAPDLMCAPYSSQNDSGCFFRKQPTTSDEVERACNAVSVSCVNAVRYAGDDPDILRRIYELGSYDSCDIARHRRTPSEELVINAFIREFGLFQKPRIHWTYIRAEEPDRVVVALCHGPDVLAIFAVDKSTDDVSLIEDDVEYRPCIDTFKRQKPKRKKWFRWPGRDAT